MIYKEKYNMLNVLDKKRENKRTYLLCQCDCGSDTKWIRADAITSGKTTSCGCANEKNLLQAKNIEGRRFGLLIARNPTTKKEKNGCIIWVCDCDCGGTCEVSSRNLLRGGTTSCGCLHHSVASEHYKNLSKKNVEKNIVEGTNLPVISRTELKSNNTSGTTGVSWDKERNKWVAQIRFQGKSKYLGRYGKIEDAEKAYLEAKDKYHNPIIEKYQK